MRGVNPSTLLPRLPRTQDSLAPLATADLLGYMAVLKELYMPPIHGGFTAADVQFESESRPRKKRTLSGGSVDLVPALGLQMDGVHLSKVKEEEFDSFDDYDDEDSYDSYEEDSAQDPFEREWAEKWLNGVVRRAQTGIENEAENEAELESLLREASAVLAMMAGTSAAGSLTRHLVFPLAPELAPALSAMRAAIIPGAETGMSPETSRFLAQLSTSPVSPMAIRRPLSSSPSAVGKRPQTALGSSVGTGGVVGPGASELGSSAGSQSSVGRPRKPAVLPVLLHDAPMMDHLSVGVQTWGSAILLGREMALRPADFGLFQSNLPHGGGTRVLELGAGTGLLSILLSPKPAGASPEEGLVVATDFLPSVLDNLRVCVDLNAPPKAGQKIEIAKLDWTTFPAYMQTGEGEEELAPWVATPFDLVLASDCVYDPTHAAMLREVAGWVLRLPSGGDNGGTFHILSPIRPTFTPELESIDRHFPPLSNYAPLSERRAAVDQFPGSQTYDLDADPLRGEALGQPHGLKLGVRGAGKRSVQGRKGEGRTDEVAGYWWWEVGWG